MSFYAFRAFSPVMQLYWVQKYGAYLARRWEETPVNLYHCADEGRGFFVEVGYDESADKLEVLRSFVRAGPLENYSHYVRLPQEWT